MLGTQWGWCGIGTCPAGPAAPAVGLSGPQGRLRSCVDVMSASCLHATGAAPALLLAYPPTAHPPTHPPAQSCLPLPASLPWSSSASACGRSRRRSMKSRRIGRSCARRGPSTSRRAGGGPLQKRAACIDRGDGGAALGGSAAHDLRSRAAACPLFLPCRPPGTPARTITTRHRCAGLPTAGHQGGGGVAACAEAARVDAGSSQ